MSKLGHGLGPCLLLCLLISLVACGSDETPLPSPTITPRPRQISPSTDAPPTTPTAQVIIPAAVTSPLISPLSSPLRAAIAGSKRVLFVQGDAVPESGYPHSRVHDSGEHPESFTRLRSEVLEGELNLGVDELVLSATDTLSLQDLMGYTVVVLGSNARTLNADEVSALTNYFLGGGSILTYADFQYGPGNWDSDNALLRTFGVEVFSDNFQPSTQITDILAAEAETAGIFDGVQALQVEGISQFLIRADTLSDNRVLATCSPIDRPGCILPPPDAARVRSGDQVACVFARAHANGGRLAGVCDRNLFQNGPGPGSDLDQADNHRFARNLFAWLAHE